MPWDDTESEELGETHSSSRLQKCTVSHGRVLSRRRPRGQSFGRLRSHCQNGSLWRKWRLQSLNCSCGRGTSRSLLQSCLSARSCKQFLGVPECILVRMPAPTVSPRIVIPWFIIWIVLEVPTSIRHKIHSPVFVKVFPASVPWRPIIFWPCLLKVFHFNCIHSSSRASILKVTKATTCPTLFSLRTRRSFLNQESFTFAFIFSLRLAS